MYPYSGLHLIQLLEKQHRSRSQSGLFKKGSFTLRWRAKVGSFPHPDLETLISAGEPCGSWQLKEGRPENKRNVGENWDLLPELPLNGYIPGSSIRGIVRAWAKQRPNLKQKMIELLGKQENDEITPGKIEFLDAWPETPTQLTLDIVNPQQNFQVYHEGQGTPLSLYTLGNGEESVPITVAIRGIFDRASETEVEEVWQWVQQALSFYGVGSRTASGYGAIKAPANFKPHEELRRSDPGFSTKSLEFSLYSQGNAGPNTSTLELRPSHWRGWLRSWMLRFFLGVMSQGNAEQTVGELMGMLEPESRRGCVRLQMVQGQIWGNFSENQPYFYTWKGTLRLTAPNDLLNKIILPIIRVAVMVGGVGRGWRRPLHIFVMPNNREAARGSHLSLTHQVPQQNSAERVTKPFGLTLKPEEWEKLYQNWQDAVQQIWSDRFAPPKTAFNAEVFSPLTCAVYLVPGPQENPIDLADQEWIITNPVETRGQGMALIYQPQYKRQPDVGGNAAGGGNAHCSWVSVKRVKIPHKQEDTGCQEVVCLFMGQPNSLRTRFLRDLHRISGSLLIFGLRSE